MKARWTLAVVGAVALVLASGCQAPAGPTEEVIIGADLELSGALAPIGKVYAQALRLKVDQVNQDGSLGRRKITLALRDNRSDPVTSTANINALAADPTVTALVTGVCGDCLLAGVKQINEARIPTVSLALPASVAAPVSERKYVFKLAPNLADDASILTSELTNSGLTKVALIASEDQFGKDAIDVVSGKMTRAGVKVVGTERVVADPDKMSAAANRLRKNQPDAVVVLAFSPQAPLLGKSVRDAGFAGRLLFGGSAADNLFLTGAAATALEGAGMVFTPTLVSDDIIATSPAKASRIAWFRDYLSKHGTYSAFASFAADAVQLIVDAVNETDGKDRDAVRTAIESSRLEGLSGPIRITPENHSGLTAQAVTMLVAANGRWRLAS